MLGRRLWCTLNIKEDTSEVYITFNGRIFAFMKSGSELVFCGLLNTSLTAFFLKFEKGVKN